MKLPGATHLVIICKTKKDADKAMVIVKTIMKRLDLTLHPTKTRLIGMWTGEEGFDFLGKPYEGKPHVRFDEEGLKYLQPFTLP